jgi:hypothetical protein
MLLTQSLRTVTPTITNRNLFSIFFTIHSFEKAFLAYNSTLGTQACREYQRPGQATRNIIHADLH